MIHHATKSTAKSASASSCRQALAAMPGTVQQIMARANMPFATVYRACNKLLASGEAWTSKSDTRPTLRSRWPLVYTPSGIEAGRRRIGPMSLPTYKPETWGSAR